MTVAITVFLLAVFVAAWMERYRAQSEEDRDIQRWREERREAARKALAEMRGRK